MVDPSPWHAEPYDGHQAHGRPDSMITEHFWVYASGIFRDQGRPERGGGWKHAIRPSIVITEHFWVYASGIFRDHDEGLCAHGEGSVRAGSGAVRLAGLAGTGRNAGL
jgi:hypothetical protein